MSEKDPGFKPTPEDEDWLEDFGLRSEHEAKVSDLSNEGFMKYTEALMEIAEGKSEKTERSIEEKIIQGFGYPNRPKDEKDAIKTHLRWQLAHESVEAFRIITERVLARLEKIDKEQGMGE